MINGILIGSGCFILFLSNICFFRIFLIQRHFRFMALLFLMILVFYLILYAFFLNLHLQKYVSFFMTIKMFSFFNGIFLHFSICYLYLYLIQVIDRSPSTRMMIEINHSPESKLNLAQIKQCYSIDEKISDKIEDMVVLGYIKKEAGQYMVTNKGRKYMNFFKFVRDFLKLERN